jgi:hypothetical protein
MKRLNNLYVVSKLVLNGLLIYRILTIIIGGR